MKLSSKSKFFVKFFNSLFLLAYSAFVFLSGNLFLISISVFFFCFLSILDFSSFLTNLSSLRHRIWCFRSLFFLFFLGLVFYYLRSDRISFGKVDIFCLSVALISSLLFTVQFLKKAESASSLLWFISGLFFCIYFPLYFFRVLLLPNGHFLFLWYFVVVKSVDAGGYIFGNFFGVHPLFAKISPKKTWEGFFGGLFFSLIIGFSLLSSFPKVFSPLSELSIWHLLILILVLGIFAILGDFFESILKRFVGVKDSGKMLPGVGGGLDTTDSLLFSGCVFYFWLLWIFNFS